jgi:type IV fimbrial biogenesis protein FimT
MQVLSCPRSVSRCGKLSVRNIGASPARHHSKSVGGSSRPFVPMRTIPLRREHGFTLVELMITMTVAIILIVIAVPSFRAMTLSNQLTTTANDVVTAINTARMEAVKRNADTQLCSNSASLNTTDTLGGGCGTQAGAVYVLTGTTATPVLAAPAGITSPLQLSGNMTAIRYGGQGLGEIVGSTAPYSGTVADICTSQSQMSSNNHRVITMTGGTILVTTTTTGSCP